MTYAVRYVRKFACSAMAAIALTVVAGSAHGASPVRYSTNGGTSWLDAASFDAAFEEVAKCNAGEAAIIELRADCEFAAPVTLRDLTLTIRSADASSVRTLTRTSADALITVAGGKSVVGELRFEDIVIDGGAKWTVDAFDGAQEEGGVSGEFYHAARNDVSGYTIHWLVIGTGATLRNICNTSGDVLYGHAGCCFRIEEDGTIENCRATGVLVNNSWASGAFQMTGGLITGCVAKTLVSASGDGSRAVSFMTGGCVSGNRVSNGSEGGFRISVPFEFSGASVVYDNTYNGQQFNVRPASASATRIKAAGDFSRTAKIGVTLGSCGGDASTVGSQFGVANATGCSGVGAFRRDALQTVDNEQVQLVGAYGEGGETLVWAVETPLDYDIAHADVTGVEPVYLRADDQPIRPEPTVVLNDFELVKGEEYELSYEGDDGVGMASVTVTGIGDYHGSVTVPYEIREYGHDVRVSVDGGATWADCGDFDAALAAVVAAGTGIDAFIELKNDVTWASAFTLTDVNLTVRTMPGADAVRTISVTDAAALLTFIGGKTVDRTLRFEDVTLDGGAVWSHPEIRTSTDNAGIACGRLVHADNNGSSSYIYVEFGDGFTLRNCQMTDDVFYGYVRSVFRFEDGMLVTGCRGAKSVVNNGAGSGGFCWDGGVASNNFTSGSALFNAAGSDPSRNYMKGGLITDNRMSVNTSPALLLSAVFAFSGDPVVSGNWYVNGGQDAWELNVRPASSNAANIRQGNNLSTRAKIGVTLQGNGSDGKVGNVFGQCGSADFIGQDAFYFSQNPVNVDIDGTVVSTNLVGSLSPELKLVWKVYEPGASGISLQEATLSRIPTKAYLAAGGVRPEPKVVVRNVELSKGYDYELDYVNATVPGTAKVIVKAIGDIYVDAVTQSYEIVSATWTGCKDGAYTAVPNAVYCFPGGGVDDDNVYGDSRAPFGSVAAAMAFAAEKGRPLIIYPGVYKLTETLSVASGLSFSSASPNPRDCVLDGGGTLRCVSLPGTGVTFAGFTVTNGFSSAGQGGGIYVAYGSSDFDVQTVVSNCVVTCCSANKPGADSVGGAMYVAGGSLVTDCLIENNVVESTDRRVYGCLGFAGGALSRFRNSVVRGNVSRSIVADQESRGTYLYEVVTEGCLFEDNVATNANGGTSCNGGGAYVYGGIVSNCIFRGNFAVGAGGGLCVRRQNSDPRLFDLTVSNNVSVAGAGGVSAISLEFASGLLVADNRGTVGGAELGHSTAAVADVRNSLFENNTGTTASGVATSTAGALRLTDCVVRGNTADGAAAPAVLFNTGWTNGMYGCVVEDNAAGGRPVVDRNGASQKMSEFRNCLFRRNTGSVCFSSAVNSYVKTDEAFAACGWSMDMANCTFLSNVCATVLDVTAEGCAKYQRAGNCLFWGNVTADGEESVSVSANLPALGEANWFTCLTLPATERVLDGTMCTPRIHSPARNAGTAMDWMDGATDIGSNYAVTYLPAGGAAVEFLGRRDRKIGGTPDIGAAEFEIRHTGLILFVR